MDTESLTQQSTNLLRTFENNFRLVQANVESIISMGGQANLARIHQVPPGQADAATISRKIQSQQFNPVTRLPREDAFRMELLDSIVTNVIKGDKDLAVAELDMDGLKGFNDKYGKDEADRILLEWAKQISSNIEANASPMGYRFACVNVHGEGSDSIKIIFIGSGLNDKKVGEIMKTIHDQPINVNMLDKAGQSVVENVEFGYGYKGMSDNMRQAIKAAAALATDDRSEAGNLYISLSQDANNRLEADKTHEEATILNKMFKATTLEELDKIFDDLISPFPRTPGILTQTYAERRQDLQQK